MIFTVRNEVAKVMFLHVSVILSTGGGVCLSACWDTTTTTPPPRTGTPLGAGTPHSRHHPQMATVADGTHPTAMHSCMQYLPPANKVWGKVISSEVCVKNSAWRVCYLSMHCRWHPSMPCSRSPGGGIPACLEGLQAYTQGGKFRGIWPGGSPGPHPRGKLRGIWSRPTPKGEVEGDLARGCLLQGLPAPRGMPALGEGCLLWGLPALRVCVCRPVATAAGGMHPTGMHFCSCIITKILAAEAGLSTKSKQIVLFLISCLTCCLI